LKKRLSETVNTATVLKAVKAEQATPQSRDKASIEAHGNDQSQDHKHGKGHWIGMNNVNRRLKLLYGEMYGMSVESLEGAYTEVTLKLPIQKETPNV
jgi:LytS/YehU family sensor histidine kinase